MVQVVSGKNWKGEDCQFYIEQTLYDNINPIKEIVLKKDFDYVALVCGLPGLGKSNFAITLAKFFCPWFDKTYIAFTAKEFIKLTNECPRYSSVILDESFASLNTQIGKSKQFLMIINHLQIIRQKNLFIFLCLPNYFDLNKGISIYRSSHLFVTYGAKFGERGKFAAFDRDKKKTLYILGQKFMNYHAVTPNFRGRFFKQQAIDEQDYFELKKQHLLKQEIDIEKIWPRRRDYMLLKIIKFIKESKIITTKELCKRANIVESSLYKVLKKLMLKGEESLIDSEEDLPEKDSTEEEN